MHEPGFDDDRPELTREDYLFDLAARTESTTTVRALDTLLSRFNKDEKPAIVESIIKILEKEQAKPKLGNIEQNFQEDMIREIENDQLDEW